MSDVNISYADMTLRLIEPISCRFLYADPTPGALQVFLDHPGLLVEKKDTLPPEQEVEEGGQWINADPIPGCIVCNIGESTPCQTGAVRDAQPTDIMLA